MTQNGRSAHKPRYWLVTSPRTASNLLVKILNLDAQGVRPAFNGGYFFMKCIVKQFTLLIRPRNTWTEEESKELVALQQSAFDDLNKFLEDAENEDQKIFVKEHAMMMLDPYYMSQYTYGEESVAGAKPTTLTAKNIENPTKSAKNLTLMPDEFLKTWYPTFLIRHPAMMLPSLYRTALSNIEIDGFKRPNNQPFTFETTMKWIRTMYEFYSEYFGEDSQWPRVIDADDVMKTPELVAKYAPSVGLEEDKLRFEWEKIEGDKLKDVNPMTQRMLSSINASNKVDTSKLAGNIDIDAEAVKWREEFGVDEGKLMEKWVREAMPDYEFMRSKRLTLE